jgi:hypothetical protein
MLSMAAMVAAVTLYPTSRQAAQIALVVLGMAALIALLLSMVQLFGFPNRSQILLLQSGEDIILATNAMHEGFKLRFLRDILGENVIAISDADRSRWKFLEEDGYYATLCVRNAKKLVILRLCTMIFDDVFAVDGSNRWEHHDSSSNADPTFAKGDMPRLRAWKGV